MYFDVNLKLVTKLISTAVTFHFIFTIASQRFNTGLQILSRV